MNNKNNKSNLVNNKKKNLKNINQNTVNNINKNNKNNKNNSKNNNQNTVNNINKNNKNNKNNSKNNNQNTVNNINFSNLYEKWGILDPEGQYINPLTKQPYQNFYSEVKNRPATYSGYAEKWSKLPVYSKRNEFIKEIRENQVILVLSGTGSGKTVLVPKFALHAYNYNAKIAVTIPKQIIVKSAAEYAAKCLDVKIGEHVGYKYRGSDSSMRSSNTNLLFTTDGTIVAQLMNDPSLSQYDMIIIDEAHERNIQIDFLLLQLKETLKLRPDFKLIIMSATINSDLFKNYFPEKEFKFKMLDAGKGNNFPITDHFLKNPIKRPDEVLENSVKKAFEIIKSEDRDGDILVFVNHKGDGNKGCELLNTLLKNENKNSINPYCGTLASGVDKHLEEMATSPNAYKVSSNKNGKNYTMKVIFSTNVAESSLTVEGVNYVIDNGYELLQSYDPDRMADSLNTHRISDAQRMQRRGRSGRTAPGQCYYMYTKEECDNLEKFPKPAIKKSDLSGEFLKFLGRDDINNIPDLMNMLNKLIEVPDKNFIDCGLKILFGLGIINSEGNLTELGDKLTKSRYAGQLSPMNAVALYWSYHYYVKNEVAAIISMVELAGGKLDTYFRKFKENKRLNISRSEQEKQYLKTKKKFANKYGDFLTLLNIYNSYINFKNENRNKNKTVKMWCAENNLSDKNLKRAINDSKQYVRMLMQSMRQSNKKNEGYNSQNNNSLNGNNINIELEKNGNNNMSGGFSNAEIETRILACFFKGYIVNYGRPKANSTKRFYNCFPKQITSTEIDNQSFLLLQKVKPKHFFYGSLQEFNNIIRFTFSSKIPEKVYNEITNIEKGIVNECSKKLKKLESNKKKENSKLGKKTGKKHSGKKYSGKKHQGKKFGKKYSGKKHQEKKHFGKFKKH